MIKYDKQYKYMRCAHIVEENAFVLFYHTNAFNHYAINQLRVSIHQELIKNALTSNVHVQLMNNNIVKATLKKNKYVNINHLLNGPTLAIYSRDIHACPLIFAYTKTIPFLLFLGGKLFNSLVGVEDFIEFIANYTKDEKVLPVQAIGGVYAPIYTLLTLLPQIHQEKTT